MTFTVPRPESQVHFLLYLQRLLEEGSFVATYKHALLLSIADVCVEKGDDTGRPLRITTNELAEKFISYYWRQSSPYFLLRQDSQHGAILKQNTGKQASVISMIAVAREEYGSLQKLKGDTKPWRALRRRVATTIRVMPLWKLQTVGRQKLEFLYANTGKGSEIELRGGVCFCFRLFYGLIHELVRGAWLRFVRGLNENRMLLGNASDLAEFMFGTDRNVLEVYKPLLIEYQSGNCFYCPKPLKEKVEVDHFVPWSRYPVDLGHNFVLAHDTWNRYKADRLGAIEHLEKWCRRNSDHGVEMAAWLQKKGLVHNLTASRQITTWAYKQAESTGSLVWRHGNKLVPLSPEWSSLLRIN